MLTAATRSPCADRTGALTDATPASRSSTLATHPCGPSSPDSTRPADPSSSGSRAPRARSTARRAATGATARTVAASPSRTNSCTLSPVSSRSRVSAGSRQLDEREAFVGDPPERRQFRPEVEPSVVVAPQQPVRLERHGETVGGRPWETGRRLETAERASADPQRHAGCRSPCRARRHPLQCPYRKNTIPDHEITEEIRDSSVRNESGTRGHRR